jgi:hypothetical protein
MSGIINRSGSESGIIGTTELDYEEGDWTPLLVGTTGSAGSASLTVSAATYIKVGNSVTVNADLRVANVGSWTGSLEIGGLPFTPVAKATGQISLLKRIEIASPNFSHVLIIYASNTNIKFFRVASDFSAKYGMLMSYFDDNLNEFVISATYFV